MTRATANRTWKLGGLTFLLIGIFVSEAHAFQSRSERDRRAQDGLGEREDLRRNRGWPRFRLPIEIQRFRTIDGTFNNYVGFFWGSAGGNLRRRVPSDYADGQSQPSGQSRKPARSISNYLCNQNVTRLNDRQLSSMVWQWGQFLDHDIDLTESADPLEAFPIPVPTGDRYFDPLASGSASIDFFRSNYRRNTSNAAREQINSITSWIDGSGVYGSDDTTAKSLRVLKNGLLKTSDGDFLPMDESGFFLAGDVRVNEQVCLTAMHTIFLREHNRVARSLAKRFPQLSDEQIYVRARQRVSGVIQAITYQEFLPALMGKNALAPYRGYNPTVFPNVSNTFSSAAYRFGHSMLRSDLLRVDNEGNEIPEGNLALRDAFFNPANLTEFGIEPYLKGLTVQKSGEIDTRIVSEVRNFLFGVPGNGGFDLAALNIQRGRDHGLADFNSIRAFYRLEKYSSFDQISSDVEIQSALKLAYHSVDDIDPWVGMLAEDHVAGASIGETNFIVFKQQFEMLRDSDRFWYERDFRPSDAEIIRNTTLADVIERNSGVRNLPANVFFIQ